MCRSFVRVKANYNKGLSDQSLFLQGFFFHIFTSPWQIPCFWIHAKHLNMLDEYIFIWVYNHYSAKVQKLCSWWSGPLDNTCILLFIFPLYPLLGEFIEYGYGHLWRFLNVIYHKARLFPINCGKRYHVLVLINERLSSSILLMRFGAHGKHEILQWE